MSSIIRDAAWWDEVRECVVSWFKIWKSLPWVDSCPGYEFVIFEDGDYGIGAPMQWPFEISFRYQLDDNELNSYDTGDALAEHLLRQAGYSEN